MALNRDTLRVEREVQALMATILDEQTRRLVAAWAGGWQRVSADLEEAITAEASAVKSGERITRTMVLRSQRLQRALDALAGVLDMLAVEAGLTITADLGSIVTNATTAERDELATQLGGVRRAELRAGLVTASPAQVQAMVRRSTERITARTWPLGAEAQAAIRAELVRGIAVGDNPRQSAARAVRRVEHRFNGGLARALTIARTETLDAHRQAGQATERANANVVGGWTWVAHFGDRRGCRACLAMHGRTFPVTEPGPEGHPNCRCGRVPVTKTWAELGFPGIPDPEPLIPDADAHFRRLPATEKIRLLGEDGYLAWRAGKYPREKWATRTSNREWRDSYQPSTPPPV